MATLGWGTGRNGIGRLDDDVMVIVIAIFSSFDNQYNHNIVIQPTTRTPLVFHRSLMSKDSFSLRSMIRLPYQGYYRVLADDLVCKFLQLHY